jgi:hypothetical protein
MSPWLTVRTAIVDQGLVVQVARPFRERVNAISYDRLLLEPAQISFLRTDRLWLAGVLAASGLALTWPGLPWSGWLLLGPGLLGAAILVLLLTVSDPRRITVFLDREQVAHPTVLRGGEDEPQAAAFVEAIREAIIEFRCQGAPADAPSLEAGAPAADGAAAGEDAGADAETPLPSLADTLDALLAMQQEGLLDVQELQRFQELAERR